MADLEANNRKIVAEKVIIAFKPKSDDAFYCVGRIDF